jgi:hypothetical protein
LSVGLDANTATERSKENGAKLPHEKNGDTRRKSERNKEERETLKLAARKKSRTGNSSSPTTKLEATTPELAAEPAAKTATGETEKMGKFRIAPNVELRGAARKTWKRKPRRSPRPSRAPG